jgi:hypothetical protein
MSSQLQAGQIPTHHQTYKIDNVVTNQLLYIEQCKILHELLCLRTDVEDTTWSYRSYNIFSYASTSVAFYYLWKQTVNCIREYVGDDRPLWMSGWLNFHKSNEVLDWHNHLGSVCHGYISIDPKNTKTMFNTGNFKKYEIQNEAGLLYLGPSGINHKVEVLEDFEGHRITLGFDVTDFADTLHASNADNPAELNWIPVY